MSTNDALGVSSPGMGLPHYDAPAANILTIVTPDRGREGGLQFVLINGRRVFAKDLEVTLGRGSASVTGELFFDRVEFMTRSESACRFETGAVK